MVSGFRPNAGLSLSANQPREKQKQQQFLQFLLVPDTKVMLPVFQLTEVLKIPYGQIVPIPHMPSWVMGVYNWRGEILWMVDLGQLVGLTPWHQQPVSFSTHKALVIHSGWAKNSENTGARGQMLGLVVADIEDIEWCNLDEIHSPPASAVTPELVPFLRGYWLNSNGEMVIAIDGEAIMAAMPKP
jgi:positive phototaxis protein PixI